jgi:(p)ppGpp synthase/HD superfamily hydrolase
MTEALPTEAYSKQYRRALKAAAKWHGDHRKKDSAVPYLSHLLTVSALVWEDGGTETEAIAALLHDAVEDGKADLDTIRERFGSDVADIVDDCSDAEPAEGEPKAPWFDRKVHHLAALREVAASDRAVPTMRVVAADKLANVRSVLVDHRSGVPDLWSRFKGGLGGSAWYYAEMSALVGTSLPGSMLARELDLAVESLGGIVTEASGEVDELAVRIAAALGTSVVRGEVDATDLLAFELARVTVGEPGDPEPRLVSALVNWLGQPSPLT